MTAPLTAPADRAILPVELLAFIAMNLSENEQ
jgi:hypothetical protein